jgi:hypothetical protein
MSSILGKCCHAMTGLKHQIGAEQITRAYAHSFASTSLSSLRARPRCRLSLFVLIWRHLAYCSALATRRTCAFAGVLQICQGLTNPWSVRDFGRARAASWLVLISGNRQSRSTWQPCHDTHRVFDAQVLQSNNFIMGVQ